MDRRYDPLNLPLDPSPVDLYNALNRGYDHFYMMADDHHWYHNGQRQENHLWAIAHHCGETSVQHRMVADFHKWIANAIHRDDNTPAIPKPQLEDYPT